MTDEERGMRFSREVRIGELLLAMGMLTGLAGWYVGKQLEPIEREIAAMKERDAKQDVQQLELKREIRDDLRVLRDKVDRLLEQQHQRRQQ